MQECWRYPLLCQAMLEDTHAQPVTRLEWRTNISLLLCKVVQCRTHVASNVVEHEHT